MNRFYQGINSAMIHGGVLPEDAASSVNVPIYQTSTFRQSGIGEGVKWEYSRTGNPTRAALESLIAELEGGTAGFAFSSGMAALTAVLTLFHTGDRILLSSNVYGGTYRVLDKVFSNFGITYLIADTSNLKALESAITDDVKGILIESPANPLLSITDLMGVADIARRHKILSVADNTFMTPYLQRPLELGFDVVVHSATKYLGGHSDLVAGLVVVKSKELAEKMAFIQNSTGGVLPPFDSFLLQRSIKTLGVRMDRHVFNAEKIALYLKSHPAVARVYYPGLLDFPGYSVNQGQARNGGVMLSFELKEGYDYRLFFKSLRLIALAESLGGVESLVCHPATMTHAAIPAEIRKKIGITDGLIRLSTGLEDVDDLTADLEAAIAASRR
ncbi:MAG TPA: methionine biosynthesis PLP-dependent protein [Succinivibrionaceae bacterium]|nr:methionine biosynthesis PLP-dependent protein [Succinivibrionaceae bacterium]